ncbi:MAG: EAL domain-containing protein [Methylococcaceae bacterium]|nr:EAL domain-containing protein [Methylococcaceae bacterium]
MNFIDSYLLPITALDKSYNPYLVFLSIIVAIVSSFTAFGIYERAHGSKSPLYQMFWVLFGAVSMGIGIWSMHFIGLVALLLPISFSFDPKITLLSIFPSIFASSVVFWLMSQAKFNRSRLLFCGVLLGAAIGAMHYISVAAMELNAGVVYLKPIFVLSIFVAIILAIISLNIKYRATTQNEYQFITKEQTLSAIVMGVAISSMHYTAMLAVEFIPVENTSYVNKGIDANYLFGIISVVSFLVISMALAVPYVCRFKQMMQALQNNEENLKIAATAFQTHEAIMVTNEHSEIIRVNDAFTRVMGYEEVDIVGKTPKILYAGNNDDFFQKKFWNTLVNEGRWSGKVVSRRKNGETFSQWQTISAVEDEQGKITHYISFFSDIKEFKLAEKEIEQLAFYDSLTGLPNRRLLHERLAHELNLARRYQRAGVLLFLDLDRFKHINDSLGHSVGDELLIETARRLQSILRDTDTAVRIGGDEFIVLGSAQDGIYSDLTEQSHVIAEKINRVILDPYFIGDHEFYISASIGITLYTGIDETVDLLLKRADTAMYQAKDAGRNTYRFYQQSMQEAADVKLDIERNLRAAILNDEFRIFYQPQHSDEKTIIAVEALMRWNNSNLGEIPPAEFIPIAEETGLILKIGQWVIETVCEQIVSWDSENISVQYIAINISAKQFHQSDFVSNLVHTLTDYEIQPKRIILEITEGVFLGNIEDVIDKMNVLKQKGFRFSIDDFGTGYSSLTYLKRLPFEQLKIDQSFIIEFVNRPEDVAIVKAICTMAKGLGLELIAEGVETEEHLAFLSGFGCHGFQGNYFSKPLTAGQLREYFKEFRKPD